MSYWDIANIFIVLLILLGVMYALLYLMKRFLYPSGTKTNGQFNINVLSTQMLMPKRFLSIVKVKDKIYLLGISEQSINMIDKLDDDGSFEDANNKQLPGANFFNVFKKSLGKQ
ncbi:MAG: flagellar biosynthetic protein FliO [Melioribacteraceae bacterium]|nr:flagellar biosynthetic protein FliO [Melioribacteraceae bacterium]